MYPSRKKFHFQVPPSDRQLWAIGMVIVQWSQLETMLYAFMSQLTQDDEKAKRAFEETRSFQIRLDQLEAIIKSEVVEPYKGRILAILIRVRNAQQMRDRIAHGTWSGPPLEEPDPKVSTFSWSKPRPPFEWNANFGVVIHAASTIDKISFDLFNSVIDPSKGIFRFGDALPHILRKSNPTS